MGLLALGPQPYNQSADPNRQALLRQLNPDAPDPDNPQGANASTPLASPTAGGGSPYTTSMGMDAQSSLGAPPPGATAASALPALNPTGPLTGAFAPSAAPATGVATDANGGAGTATAPAPGLPQSPTAASSPGAVSQADLDAASRAKLLNLMSPQATDGATLATSPEAAAERYASQRAAETQTAQAAEQAARNGTNGSGGAAAISRGILQNEGASDTGFLGQLSQQEKAQNIQQLEFALSQAQQAGQFDRAQALQGRIADLQSSTQLGINENDLGFNYAQLQQQANQSALLTLLNGAPSGGG